MEKREREREEEREREREREIERKNFSKIFNHCGAHMKRHFPTKCKILGMSSMH